jgi:hypothetical protein
MKLAISARGITCLEPDGSSIAISNVDTIITEGLIEKGLEACLK